MHQLYSKVGVGTDDDPSKKETGDGDGAENGFGVEEKENSTRCLSDTEESEGKAVTLGGN